MPLMVSVSGVRGIVGIDLTPEVIVHWVSAFASQLPKGAKVVVGGDPRPTREAIRKVVFGTLESCGCQVYDLGIAATPTIAIGIEELHADGGIAITASHNPAEWNALKFFRKDGRFLLESEGRMLHQIVSNRTFHYSEWRQLGTTIPSPLDIVDAHIERVLKTPGVDVDAIRHARLKVSCDGGNGVAGKCIPRLLEKLNVQMSDNSLGMDADGNFQRKLEPTPDVLIALGEEVIRSHSDIGFAFDPDGDRLAIVGSDGTPLGEETTLVIAIDQVLRVMKGPVVVNISTTMAVEEIAKRYQVPVYRTKVGEANVAEKMLEVNAVCGGEGNGGVMVPSCHPGRDSLVGIALILSAIAQRGPLSQILKEIPRYELIKRSIHLDSNILEKYGGIHQFLEAFANERPYELWDRLDGLKQFREHGWVQIRGSNTEPIIRVFAEATTKDLAESYCDDLFHRIGRFIS
ncbi:MAG: phosphoglucosamine mutase [bacterium]|nr:phosphoglucosamine mutase [bacterium]